ncbi:MAG: hypothetical protein OXR62_15570 [Ahrensia sp.]|nr:hypothetical protein [Ahrensia sp.]
MTLVERLHRASDRESAGKNNNNAANDGEHRLIDVFLIRLEADGAFQTVKTTFDLSKAGVDLFETPFNLIKISFDLLKSGIHVAAHGFNHLFECLKLIFGHGGFSFSAGEEYNKNIWSLQGIGR